MERREKTLFLIDAMSLIFRAYYALNKNPRLTSNGINTSAILGFTNALYDIIKKESPTHIAVAFDSHGPTVRHAEFEQYKAQREATPDEIVSSLPYIQEILQALGIPILAMPGYEADDIIGTFAKNAEQNGFTTFMMTTDKDYGQLVSENIYIYKPERNSKGYSIVGVPEICEKYAIQDPEQLIDILGIWGDAVDNIPGIKGVGEVGAKKLIQEFGSIENMIAKVDTIKNEKLRQKIKEGEESALISKHLATIILDVPIEFDEQAMRFDHGNKERLKKVFAELEFKVLAQKFLNDEALNKHFLPDHNTTIAPNANPSLFDGLEEKAAKQSNTLFDLSEETNDSDTSFDKNIQHYTLINDKEEAIALAEQLRKVNLFSFMTISTQAAETTNLLALAFAWQRDEAFCLILPQAKTEKDDCLQLFAPAFANEHIEKVAYNIKEEIKVLNTCHIEIKGKCFDTLLAHYVLEPESRHQMEALCQLYLNYQMLDFDGAVKKTGIGNIDKDSLTKYAGEIVDKNLQLKEKLLQQMQEKDALHLFADIEMPLSAVLANMEQEGVRIDVDFLHTYSQVLQERIDKIQANIYQMAGMVFNIASPKQLGEVLFDHMKIINNAKLTKSKQYQTGEDVLQKLAGKHPIINEILDYRSLTKLKSTYVDSFPTLVSKIDGRVHGQFNQAVTATGRLSSSNPNLQNIPIRTEEGKEMRRAFVAKNADYTLLAADYSQIELRIVAVLAQDESMMNAFYNGEDIHTATAARIFAVDADKVEKAQRRIAKTVNFGILYGMSAFGLSERLQISRKEAGELIEQYFSQYPRIRKYIDSQIEYAREHGYVETLMHRRRYLKNINNANANLRHFDERNAVNAPIQGSAADLIKVAMVNIFEDLRRQHLQSKIILQVHDELVLDVYLPELERVKDIVKHNMTTAVYLPIPLTIDMNTGRNWLEAH